MHNEKQLDDRISLIAIREKYNGKSSKEIVDAIKEETGKDYKWSTINVWFYSGGKLHQKYLDHVDKFQDQLMQQAQQAIKGMTFEAIKVLKDSMVELIEVKVVCPNCKEEFSKKIHIPTGTKLTASKEILDRSLGKSPDTVNINNKTGKFIDLTEDEIDSRIIEIETQAKTNDGGTKTIEDSKDK